MKLLLTDNYGNSTSFVELIATDCEAISHGNLIEENNGQGAATDVEYLRHFANQPGKDCGTTSHKPNVIRAAIADKATAARETFLATFR